MRSSPVPFIAVALLLGLVLLIPERDPGQVAVSLATGLRPLDLTPPPTWAVGRATDEIERNLDRLYWAGHESLQHSQEALRRHQGELASELLARLVLLGESEPIATQKLLGVLAFEPSDEPGVLDEFIRRSRSGSGLVARTALRALAVVPDHRATTGIASRLNDADLGVRSFARAALAKRARLGDPEAQRLIVVELLAHPESADLAYLAACDAIEVDDVVSVLESVAVTGDETGRLLALTVLLKRGDPDAEATFVEMLGVDDTATRVNALQAVVAARRVLAPELWDVMAQTSDRLVVLALADMLLLAVDTGHPEADKAILLLDDMAANRFGSSGAEVTSALFQRGDAAAVERTRDQLQDAVGATLSQIVDRLISAPTIDHEAFVTLTLERLDDPGLRPEDRVLLLRLLSHTAPDQALDPLVDTILEWAETRPRLANASLVYLDRLGLPLISKLSGQIGTPVGDSMFIYAAAKVRSGLALPYLEAIVLDETAVPALRTEALDTIARLRDGPREEALRRIVEVLRDPAIRERARLLYWNYL